MAYHAWQNSFLSVRFLYCACGRLFTELSGQRLVWIQSRLLDLRIASRFYSQISKFSSVPESEHERLCRNTAVAKIYGANSAEIALRLFFVGMNIEVNGR